jgi:hypothetical protein
VGCILSPLRGFERTALCGASPSAPAQLAPIAIHVAVLAAEFPALMTGGAIVSAPQVAPQLAAIMSDFRFIVPDVAAHPAVTIPGKRRRHTHAYQQKNSNNRAFHIFFLRPQFAASK